MQFSSVSRIIVVSGVAAWSMLMVAGQPVLAAPRRSNRTTRNNTARNNSIRLQNVRRQQALLNRQAGKSRQQQDEASREWQAMMLGELDGVVQLTDQQKADIRPLLADEAKQISALGNDRNLTQQDRQDQLQQIADAEWDKISPILTPDQLEKIDEQQQDSKLDRLAKLLGLSAEQKDQIKPILEDEAQQTEAVRQDKSLSQQDQNAKLQAIDDTTWEKVEPILTAAQQQKLDQVRLDDKLQTLTKALTLTTTEKDRIKPILEDSATQVRQTRADKSLAPDAKETKLNQIRSSMWDQIKPILTSSQQKKLDELLTTGKTTPTRNTGVTPRRRTGGRRRG